MQRWLTSLRNPTARTLATAACIGTGGVVVHQAYRYFCCNKQRQTDKATGDAAASGTTTRSELDQLVSELIQAATIEELESSGSSTLAPKPLARVYTDMERCSAVPARTLSAIELPAMETVNAVLEPSAPTPTPTLATPPTRPAVERRCYVVVANFAWCSDPAGFHARLRSISQGLGDMDIPFTKLVLDRKVHKKLFVKYKKISKKGKLYPQIFVEDAATGSHTSFISHERFEKMLANRENDQTALEMPYRIDYTFARVPRLSEGAMSPALPPADPNVYYKAIEATLEERQIARKARKRAEALMARETEAAKAAIAAKDALNKETTLHKDGDKNEPAEIEETELARLPLVPKPLAAVDAYISAVPVCPQAAIEQPAVDKDDEVLEPSELLSTLTVQLQRCDAAMQAVHEAEELDEAPTGDVQHWSPVAEDQVWDEKSPAANVWEEKSPAVMVHAWEEKSPAAFL